MKSEDRRRMHKAADSNLLVVILLKDMDSLARAVSCLTLLSNRVNDHFKRTGQLFISSKSIKEVFVRIRF